MNQRERRPFADRDRRGRQRLSEVGGGVAQPAAARVVRPRPRKANKAPKLRQAVAFCVQQVDHASREARLPPSPSFPCCPPSQGVHRWLGRISDAVPHRLHGCALRAAQVEHVSHGFGRQHHLRRRHELRGRGSRQGARRQRHPEVFFGRRPPVRTHILLCVILSSRCCSATLSALQLIRAAGGGADCAAPLSVPARRATPSWRAPSTGTRS